jgi:hypothetical protein
VTREICSGCGRISRVGFSVPDDVWKTLVGWQEELLDHGVVLCLACFTERADDAGIEWDREIQFWPVSLVTHRRHVEDGP